MFLLDKTTENLARLFQNFGQFLYVQLLFFIQLVDWKKFILYVDKIDFDVKGNLFKWVPQTFILSIKKPRFGVQKKINYFCWKNAYVLHKSSV